MVTIIAEIGSNWDGSFDLALQHLWSAREAGADGVKFQLYRAESLDSRPDVQETLTRYEMPVEVLDKLVDLAHKVGLLVGVTPFSPVLANSLEGMALDFVKIAAPDLTYHTLIKAAATLDKPIVLSTMMATAPEIDEARRIIRQTNDQPLTLLTGLSAYPAEARDQHLARLWTLQEKYKCFVGFSDHTLDYESAPLAVAAGATWIEHHFAVTSYAHHSQKNQTPDQCVSFGPQEMARYVYTIRRAENVLGSPVLRDHDPERAVRETCRRRNDRPLRG